MPDRQVFSRISNRYYELTAAEKKVADFVLAQQQKTQYMSISELAEICGVAEATITRFCRSLEYKGFSAFKLAIANSTATRSMQGLISGEVMPDDSIPDMSQKLCNADIEAITTTRDLISPENIKKAADLMLGADKVFCFGQGGSMLLAQEAAHLFSTAFPNCFSIADSHLQTIAAAQMSERDVVLYFSYSGATRDLMDLLETAKKSGAKIILITRFRSSPGATMSDIVLVCGSNETPLQLGSVAARIAQLYLLDVLFAEMCRRDEDGCKAARTKIADALSEKHI